MSTRSLSLALVLALSLPASSALAWPTLEADGPRTSLLGGRWTIALGPDASVAAAVTDPRAPMPRAELDGVAAVRAEEGRLAVRATLLSATRPADLEAVVRALPAPCASPTIAPFPDHEGTVAITCTEPSPDGAFRPLVLYATHTDGWVDRFELQVETDAEADTESAIAFARAAAATLRPEPVAPAVERGTLEIARACPAGDAADALTLTLPDDWVATRQGDQSTTAVQLLRVTDLGVRRPIAAVIFSPLGAVPARIPAGAGTPHRGTLLGRDAEWLEIAGSDQMPGVREIAMGLSLECGEGSTPWSGTIQLSAGGSPSLVDEATRVLETLALSSARGHTLEVTPLSTEEEPAPEIAVEDTSAEDAEAERTSHLWSMGIGAVSLVLLAAALVLRSRTTRPK